MVVQQGEVWWADLGEALGSGPGYRRPVLVVQGDALNRSRVSTVLCVPLTTHLKWAEAPGNILLEPKATGLDKDSVANASQLTSLDKQALTERVGKLTAKLLEQALSGIDVVLGR